MPWDGGVGTGTLGGVAVTPESTWGVLLAVLAAVMVCDLRSRRVPAWLSGGGIAAGVLLAAWAGPAALRASLAGAAVGGLAFLPFVWRGWLGGADALLLAAVGAWQGWRSCPVGGLVDGLPHAQLPPPAQPSPAGHAVAVAQGLGQGAPAQPLP